MSRQVEQRVDVGDSDPFGTVADLRDVLAGLDEDGGCLWWDLEMQVADHQPCLM